MTMIRDLLLTYPNLPSSDRFRPGGATGPARRGSSRPRHPGFIPEDAPAAPRTAPATSRHDAGQATR